MRIQCGSCDTQYDLKKEHKPLAGRQFPCSKCQGEVSVPALPWEDPPKKKAPPAPEEASSQKHVTITVSCANCLEDYNVSSDDGLEGMAFPCDTCGEDVTVPALPWDESSAGSDDFDDEDSELAESFRNLDLEIPEERALEPIDGALTVTISCENCLEDYNVSAEDGLAGMGFPCDNCGGNVDVPPHPWPEIEESFEGEFDDLDFSVGVEAPEQDAESDSLELPSEQEFAPIEGGQAITLTCENCLEEYNLSADDGLAGMDFPCDTCGQDVFVPEHPWPEVQAEEEYPDDFLDVGTPVSPKEESGDTADPDEKLDAEDGFELPEEKDVAPIDGGLKINLTCENCLEEYNLSADDGLAGMDFPCETCGEDVSVPEHPWPEVEEDKEYPDDFLDVGTPIDPTKKEAGSAAADSEKAVEELQKLALPEEKELPPLEGHDKCTITCENCLEEYYLSAEDGLAGMEFPCEVCGEMVDVPPHPWPVPEGGPEQAEEDFLDVGVSDEAPPLKEEEEEEEPPSEPEKPKPKKKKPKPEKAAKPKVEPVSEAESKSPPKVSGGGDGIRLVPKTADPIEEQEGEELLAEDESAPEEKKGKQDPESSKRPKASGKGKKKKPRKPSTKAKRSAALPGDLPSRRMASAMAKSALPDEAFEEEADPLEEGVSTGPQAEPSGQAKAPKAPKKAPRKAPKKGQAKAPKGKGPRRRPSANAKSSAREAHKQLPPSRGVHIPSGESRSLSVGGPGEEALEEATESGVRSFNEIAAESQKLRQGFGKTGAAEESAPEGAVAKVFWRVSKIFGKRAGDPKDLLASHVKGKAPATQPGRKSANQRVEAKENLNEKRPPASRQGKHQDVASVGLVALDDEEDENLNLEGDENGLPDDASQWEKFVHRVRNAPRLVLIAAGVVLVGLLSAAVYLDEIISRFAEPTGTVDPNQFWVQRADSQKMDEEDADSSAKAESESDSTSEGVDTSQLTSNNVDQLGYEHLLPLVRTLRSRKDQSKRDLLLWGTYRLASSFEDKNAFNELEKTAPKKLNSEEYGPMGLGAIAGLQRLQGKGRGALKALEKLSPGEGSKSAQILLVGAQIRSQQGDKPKAIEILNGLLEANPNVLDAQLLRANLVSDEVPVESWKPALIAAANNSGDVDSVVRAASLLARRGQFEGLAPMLENYNSIMVANRVAPPRRDTVLSLLVAKNLIEGEYEVAESLAAKLVALSPDDLERVRTHAALKQAIGGNPLPTLDKGISRVKRSSKKLELMADKVGYQIANKDVKSAVGSLRAMASLGKRKGRNWALYAEGLIGQGTGRLKAARKSFQKAAKGRSRLPQAEFALAMLDKGKKGPSVDTLRKLVSKNELPVARLRLGRALLEGENPAEGLALLEDLLWNRQFVGDPSDLVLSISDGYSRLDKKDIAETIASDLHETRPNDPRPLEQLIKIAEQNNDRGAVTKWQKLLSPLQKESGSNAAKAPPKEGANP